ncbi:hypothetical protein [Sphingopyxis sp. 113P3]|uniref:hypothetical protein n=1 Tax=Sphingopyxis sp. (strain 113P3) TaxID=292913 RepID=UPI0006AD2586|nr:hypothetical protein [Sphingopyxis sp. 113P3]ALC11264.1 hypothetical protein LH20_04785 [Sphingopyxis sp. 113P3]
MTTANLKAAARLAREASRGRRTIELFVTEEGVVVRGWTVVREQMAAASHEVTWRELDAAVDLASNAVALVDRRLSAMEGAGA